MTSYPASDLVGDVSQFPLLVGHMIQKTEMEGGSIGHWSFKEMLDKLLTVVVLPVRQALSQVTHLTEKDLYV